MRGETVRLQLEDDLKVLKTLDPNGFHVDPIFDQMNIERDLVYVGKRSPEDHIFVDTIATPYYGFLAGDIIIYYNQHTFNCNVGVCVRNDYYESRNASLADHSVVVTNVVSDLKVTVKSYQPHIALPKYSLQDYLDLVVRSEIEYRLPSDHEFEPYIVRRQDILAVLNGEAAYVELTSILSNTVADFVKTYRFGKSSEVRPSDSFSAAHRSTLITQYRTASDEQSRNKIFGPLVKAPPMEY